MVGSSDAPVVFFDIPVEPEPAWAAYMAMSKEWQTETHPMKSFEPDQEGEMKAEAGTAGWYDANMKWAADTELPYRRQRAFEQIVGQIRVHRLVKDALLGVGPYHPHTGGAGQLSDKKDVDA